MISEAPLRLRFARLFPITPPHFKSMKIHVCLIFTCLNSILVASNWAASVLNWFLLRTSALLYVQFLEIFDETTGV
jgi:hypothetical protein